MSKWLFGQNLQTNGLYGKSEHPHIISHIPISVGAIFQPQETILIFWTTFT